MLRRNEYNPAPELMESLAKVQLNMVQPTKTKSGHFGKYADLADIDSAVRLAIKSSSEPLAYTQSINTNIDSNGKRMAQIVTTITHSSGEYIDVEGLPVEFGTTPQQMLANTTYARRGSLAAAFGIVADDDDDGENITALKQEQIKHDNVRKAIIAKLKEVLKSVPKEKLDQVFATGGMTSKDNNDTQLNKLSADKASLLAGAAIFAKNDAGIE